jgi:hypothetical protein
MDSGPFFGPTGPETGFHLLDWSIALIIGVPLLIAGVGFVLGRWSTSAKHREPTPTTSRRQQSTNV